MPKRKIMKYKASARSKAHSAASIQIKQTEIPFGMTKETSESLGSPAELFLGAFTSCVLKNVERFSAFIKFEYTHAEITVDATRLEKPPRMDALNYHLKIHSNDESLNINLLRKNIEKFGTIYNTVKASCEVEGIIEQIKN